MKSRKPMGENDLKDLTQMLLNEAESYLEEEVSESRAKALRYYEGRNPDPLPIIKGRSKMVVTEVRDTIEWILPDLVKIFTSGDEVVSIDPQGTEDTLDADVAEDWITDVLMRM